MLRDVLQLHVWNFVLLWLIPDVHQQPQTEAEEAELVFLSSSHINTPSELQGLGLACYPAQWCPLTPQACQTASAWHF